MKLTPFEYAQYGATLADLIDEIGRPVRSSELTAILYERNAVPAGFNSVNTGWALRKMGRGRFKQARVEVGPRLNKGLPSYTVWTYVSDKADPNEVKACLTAAKRLGRLPLPFEPLTELTK